MDSGLSTGAFGEPSTYSIPVVVAPLPHPPEAVGVGGGFPSNVVNDLTVAAPVPIAAPPPTLIAPQPVHKPSHEVIHKPIGKVSSIIKCKTWVGFYLKLFQGPYGCQVCSKEFTKISELKKHEKQHLDDRRYRCPKCPASFNVEKNLLLHDAGSHQTSILECPDCGRSFNRIASFKSHLTIHQEEDNLTCPVCEAEFPNEVRFLFTNI